MFEEMRLNVTLLFEIIYNTAPYGAMQFYTIECKRGSGRGSIHEEIKQIFEEFCHSECLYLLY